MGQPIDSITCTNTVTVSPDTPLREGIAQMREQHSSYLLIADGGKPLGIYTERDAIQTLHAGIDPARTPIRDLMTHPVIATGAETSLTDAYRLLTENNIRHLLVTDETGAPRGVLTQTDIIHSLQQQTQCNERLLNEAKEALQEKSIYLDSILSSSINSAIAATDIHFRVIYFNPRAEELFGCKAKEVIGRTVMEIHEERGIRPERLERAMEKVARQGEHSFSFRVASTEGERLLEARVAKILNREDHAVGYTFISRDITEQRQMEQAIHTLMETAAGAIGDRFFETIVQRLSVWLDLDFAFIGHIKKPDYITTIALQIDGELVANTTYSLHNAPCKQAAHTGYCFCPRELTRRFPDNEMLAEFGAESYIGVPLKDQDNQTIGILCGISRREMILPRNTKEVLNIIAAKASAELERKLAEEKLMLASHVYENSIEGIMVTDVQGRILSVNPAFTAITGYSAEEAIGNTPRLLKSNKHDRPFYKQMWRAIITRGYWKGEIWNRRKSGEIYPERLTISTVRGPGGKAIRYTAIFYDITDIKESEDKIRHRAFHDPLTELPNRLLFQDRLLQAIAHAKRSNDQLAIMFMDVDHFKNLNDSLGHHMGDIFLHQLATQLTGMIRVEDTVSRLGGDEFTILLTQISSEADAASIASKILALFKTPFSLGGHNIHLGASIGIALYPNDGGDPDTLIRNADTAMYHAKEQGRNNYQFFTSEMEQRVRERVILEADLRKGLERDEFDLHYQPIYHLDTETVMGFEALIRWRHPQSGFISPAKFIPLAEERGLIIPIGEWVLKRACQQLEQWNGQTDKPLYMSINISAHQFTRKTFIQTISNLLHESTFTPEQLIFEITETAMMDNLGYTIQTLKQLQAMGIKIAMDDFGTGYSSFTYLKQLPIDILKLDHTFMRDVMHSTDSAEIAASIIDLARKLRLNVIAEGIESAEQLAFLKSHRCARGQGYLFNRPLPQAEAGALLKSC